MQLSVRHVLYTPTQQTPVSLVVAEQILGDQEQTHTSLAGASVTLVVAALCVHRVSREVSGIAPDIPRRAQFLSVEQPRRQSGLAACVVPREKG